MPDSDRRFEASLMHRGSTAFGPNMPGLCPGDTGSNPVRPSLWNGTMPGRTMQDLSAQPGEVSTPPGDHEPLNLKSKSADTGKDA